MNLIQQSLIHALPLNNHAVATCKWWYAVRFIILIINFMLHRKMKINKKVCAKSGDLCLMGFVGWWFLFNHTVQSVQLQNCRIAELSRFRRYTTYCDNWWNRRRNIFVQFRQIDVTEIDSNRETIHRDIIHVVDVIVFR